jgi:aminopeptidase C
MSDVPRYLKIADSHDLLRDTHSMGVTNTNRQALAAALRKKDAVLRTLALEQRKEEELNTLREEVSELKALVRQLLDQKG